MAAIYRKRLIKKPVKISRAKKHVIWLDGPVKILHIHHSIFPRRTGQSKWRFDYCGTWANFTQVKLVKIALLRTLFGQKLGQHGLHPKWSSIFLWKYQNEIISSQELFISSKYRKFWLSYEWFFDLCNILLPKPAISGWKDMKDVICG